MKKNALSKMDENPAQKMQVTLRTAPLKTKLLKFNWFTTTFGRWKIDCAPHHRIHGTKRAVQNGKIQVKNRKLIIVPSMGI